MNRQITSDRSSADTFQRIANAIEHISTNFREQPTLDHLAEHAGMSRFHFQRTFTELVGISPKRFLQVTSLRFAKEVLQRREGTLFETAWQTGLSGTGRLHDLFVTIEGMTPGEYREKGMGVEIHWSSAATDYGHVVVASTDRGICWLQFVESVEFGVEALRDEFPEAALHQSSEEMHRNALQLFQREAGSPEPIRLSLKGTPFQIKVWEALLAIPSGELRTYGEIAETIGEPTASRAVGRAVGANSVALVIPCHRVIQASGRFGGYRWGSGRKQLLIAGELGE